MKNSEIRRKAQQILDNMSLSDKIGQLNQEPINEQTRAEVLEKVRRGMIGSVILAGTATAGNDKQEQVIQDMLSDIRRIAKESSSGIPVIVGRDVIHGHKTVLPIPLALSAMFHPAAAKEAYRCIAREAAKEGIHWTFSPMMDISRDPRWGRCIEGFGEDPYLAERMAEAVVRGFQGDDLEKPDSIAACAKHYICYGAVEGGRDYGHAEVSDYTLRNYYLRPFRAAVNAGIATVMNSFNEISGETTSTSHYLLTELLKEELGFDGFVVSDWGTIGWLETHGLAESRAHAAELSIHAGLDMDMASKCYIDNLEKLVEKGKVSVSEIDEAVLRILTVKIKLGLFDQKRDEADGIVIDETEHYKRAKRCSDESMVLLKNKNGILPLSTKSKIFATGPMLFEKRALWGSWTLDGDIQKTQSVAEAWRKRNTTVIFPESKYLWDDPLKAIRRSECDAIVVLLGESQKSTGEANSMSRIELPAEQLELVKKLYRLNKPIIGVMAFGRPIALEEAEPYFDAILYAWHGGTYAAESILDILYGDVNPSGRLPMTFPRCTGQVPIYYNCANGPSYGESYYVDTRLGVYNDCLATPLYPFGYGKSYTEFVYSNIYCEHDALSLAEIGNGAKFRIHVTIKNAGKVDGWEVAQCYVHDKVATMVRPQRELKGFCKKWIRAEKSEEVWFELGFEELAFYRGNKRLSPELGEFDLYIGKDSYAPYCLTITITE